MLRRSLLSCTFSAVPAKFVFNGFLVFVSRKREKSRRYDFYFYFLLFIASDRASLLFSFKSPPRFIKQTLQSSAHDLDPF